MAKQYTSNEGLRPDLSDTGFADCLHRSIVEARGLLAEGLDPEAVAESTGLPIDELPDPYDEDELEKRILDLEEQFEADVPDPEFASALKVESIKKKSKRVTGKTIEQLPPVGTIGKHTLVGERAVVLSKLLRYAAREHSAVALSGNGVAISMAARKQGKSAAEIEGEALSDIKKYHDNALEQADSLARVGNYEDKEAENIDLHKKILKDVVSKFFYKSNNSTVRSAEAKRVRVQKMAERYAKNGTPYPQRNREQLRKRLSA